MTNCSVTAVAQAPSLFFLVDMGYVFGLFYFVKRGYTIVICLVSVVVVIVVVVICGYSFIDKYSGQINLCALVLFVLVLNHHKPIHSDLFSIVKE